MWHSAVYSPESVDSLAERIGRPVPGSVVEIAEKVYREGGDRYSYRAPIESDGTRWSVFRVLGYVYVELYRPATVNDDPLTASELRHGCSFVEQRRLRPIAATAVFRGSVSDVKTDLVACFSVPRATDFPDVPDRIIGLAGYALSHVKAVSRDVQHVDVERLRWYVETTDHPRDRVLIHVGNADAQSLTFRESCLAGIMPSAHQVRREQLRDREKTRWRVVVMDCRADRATAADGTPCLDTYTKAGFPSIRAAEQWIAQHPCGRCCTIVDAHLELPWGSELWEASKASMERERQRLIALAEQRRRRRVCRSCGKNGLDDETIQYRSRIDGGQYLCGPCAEIAIVGVRDDDVIADRYTQHVNRLGYDAEVPEEIREYHESEHEWMQRFPHRRINQ